jgi:hypothetical protein
MILKSPVELHGGDGSPGRGTGHALNRDLGQSCQFDEALHIGFSVDEGVPTIDVPASEKEISGSPIISPAVREVGVTFRLHMSPQRMGFSIPGEGAFFLPLKVKKKGKQGGIAAIAQDDVRIEASQEPFNLSEIHPVHIQPIALTLQDKGSGADRVSIHLKLHDPKIRKRSIVCPHRFRGIRMNLNDPISFDLDDTPSRREEPFSVEVGLWQRDVTIVEGDRLLPSTENPWKLGVEPGRP